VAAAARREPAGEGRRPLVWLWLAGAAVMGFFVSARLGARAPWSYDEYFHLGLAREMWRHFPVRSFPWTPFSLVGAHFADGSPLFHLLLMPFARLPIEWAGLAGVVAGQVFVVACLGTVLWRMKAGQAWAYVLGLTTLGSLFAVRFDMCRPQLMLIGFSLLVLGLLVTGARPWVLVLVTAAFALAHAGAWIAIFYAVVWGVAGWLVPAAAATGGATAGRRGKSSGRSGSHGRPGATGPGTERDAAGSDAGSRVPAGRAASGTNASGAPAADRVMTGSAAGRATATSRAAAGSAAGRVVAPARAAAGSSSGPAVAAVRIAPGSASGPAAAAVRVAAGSASGPGAPESPGAAAAGRSGEAASLRGHAPARGLLWRPVVWVAAGWLLAQVIHPNVPYNLRLMALVNLVVPFEASPAGNAALRSQIGEELTPPALGVLAEQWAIFLGPLVVAVSLVRERRLRSRAVLTTALVAWAFLLLGSVLLRRMLEVGAPLGLLALAALAVERRRQGLGAVAGSWTGWAAGGALLIGALWTGTTVRMYGFGEVSQPQEMARWLGEHGQAGARVFTAQWADSAPLFYYAPRLQSLVALDPTMFFAQDRRLFGEYVELVQGRRAGTARAVRERFGARYVTIWQAPVYERFAQDLMRDPGARLVYKDPYYLIADLGGR
jgi:hypothetical protein